MGIRNPFRSVQTSPYNRRYADYKQIKGSQPFGLYLVSVFVFGGVCVFCDGYEFYVW